MSTGVETSGTQARMASMEGSALIVTSRAKSHCFSSFAHVSSTSQALSRIDCRVSIITESF